MITYKLNRYSLGDDQEKVIFENENESVVENHAIESSKEHDEGLVGYWTYRLERWEDEKMVGGWRFFNNGKEFTDRIRGILKYRTKGK